MGLKGGHYHPDRAILQEQHLEAVFLILSGSLPVRQERRPADTHPAYRKVSVRVQAEPKPAVGISRLLMLTGRAQVLHKQKEVRLAARLDKPFHKDKRAEQVKVGELRSHKVSVKDGERAKERTGVKVHHSVHRSIHPIPTALLT